jgi:hypothetical protein
MGTLHGHICTLVIMSLSVLLRMRMFQIKFVQKINAHILRSQNFLSENLSVYEECGKTCRAGQATDDKMEHANCMLDT